VAEFDKAVLPGGEGKITLRVKTEGYAGSVSKQAKVFTNDPARGMMVIKIKAHIQPLISVSPRHVLLRGAPEEAVTATVIVDAGLERPLELMPSEFSLNGKLNYDIEEMDRGKTYRITFKRAPGPPESYQGWLRLKTNYPEKPEVTIRIRAQFNS
jgi:hypothetical protein